ncbi:hypothetical protein Pla175_22240 [Pirellulimonas nuda]|uniref:mannan endo-1,4-beta-mannosidase n=1 Tax=Pirellulimonas nuda TaxID=2528009 RepID=A0A518DBJ8_9BACT|nr:cellulase family glycosylhydrolase [Pirellulimonas nuda]QDU88840.1 hypothetical protein Pla175_22240 [Pirellulimonas nuda]
MIAIRSVVLLAAAWGAAAPTGAAPPQEFITRRGAKLYDGAREFRFVSWNAPNLHLVEDAFTFLGGAPWRYPDAFEVRDALRSIRQMGGTVVRPYVISVRRNDGDMGPHAHVAAPGEFNEQAFAALDLVLKTAEEEGVRVIIPLVDNWKWWGGVEQYVAFRGKQGDDFWTDPQLIDDFKQTIHYLVNRRNTLTGRRYRDDPALFGWETGNELDATPEWTRQIAAYIKGLDPNHLVIDGRSLHGVPEASLDDPNVDVVTTHHYPNVGNNNAASIRAAVKAVDGKKAYFVGEFGFVPVDEAQRMLDAVHELGVSGALYWSLRFHRREGGFYWHHEPSGGDLYKAYHWPGFASGDEYRENQVLPMIRDAAFRIRGQRVPPVASPEAPTLLPILDVAHIAWQGAAGGRAYDVQRSERVHGPWEVVGKDVSDAAVQYRPLFADRSARIGGAYYYRVVAKNEGGASPPSNAVGPVEVTHQTLVDEMRDLSLVHAAAQPYGFRTGDARKTQEDIHRVELGGGGSLVYRSPGKVAKVTLWCFASSDDAPIRVAASDKPEGPFAELPTKRTTAPSVAGDYGYLRPILVEAGPVPADARYIRIEAPAGAADSNVQLSRIEVRYGDSP